MPDPSDGSNLVLALAEAEAMRSITEILAGLDDDESRVRVLRWCHEHFQSELLMEAVARTAEAPPPAIALDPALSVGADVFDGLEVHGDLVKRDDDCLVEIPPAGDPIYHEEQLHCHDAVLPAPSLEGLEVEVDVHVEMEPAEEEHTDAKPMKPAGTNVGLDSLIRDFVHELQQLALECQIA